jgi:hypothetical protein
VVGVPAGDFFGKKVAFLFACLLDTATGRRAVFSFRAADVV